MRSNIHSWPLPAWERKIQNDLKISMLNTPDLEDGAA